MAFSLSSELRGLIETETARVLDEVVAFRRERHRSPDLTWQEQATAAAGEAQLRRIDGLVVTPGVGRHGIVALLQGALPGPTIALRADMDALPVQEATGKAYASCKQGVMHACGHDGHMANLLGSALVLSRLRGHVRGQVKFIFQPAEEGGAGAEEMCEDGALEQPAVDLIFGLHGWPESPCGEVSLKSGPLLAATTTFHLTVSGTGCHAAMPHLGTDQILTAARIVDGLQSISSRVMSPTEPIALSVTKFHGGTADNVLPSTVTLTGTLRTFTPAAKERATAAMQQLVQGIAAAHGASAELRFDRGYPPTVNDAKATDYLQEVATAMLGERQVKRLAAPTMGGEDFAFYLQRVPGAFFFLGVGDGRKEGYPGLHHPAFDFNDAALPAGIKMFTAAVLGYTA